MDKSIVHFFCGWGFDKEIARNFVNHDTLITYSWNQSAQPMGDETQVLIAWSLGSLGLIRSMKNFAKRKVKICFINGFARLREDKEYEAVRDFALKATKQSFIKSPKTSIETFFKRAALGDNDDYKKYLLPLTKNNISELLSGLNEMQQTDLRQDFINITDQVLVIISKKDKIVPYVCGKYFLDNCISAKEVLLENMSHCIPFDLLNEYLIKEGFIRSL